MYDNSGMTLRSTEDLSALQATMEWEAQDEGVLAKILMGDGAKDIAVGTPVAVIVEDAKDVRQISHMLIYHLLWYCLAQGAHSLPVAAASCIKKAVYCELGVPCSDDPCGSESACFQGNRVLAQLS